MKTLLRLMLKEEYRMHVSYSSQTIFLALPAFVCIVSFFIGMTLGNLTQSVSLEEMIVLTNVGLFLYGLSVGAFGFLGRTYIERRHGRFNYLIAMPTTLPLSFKKTFLGMFLRDVVFYLALILLPATAGLLIAVPFAPLSLFSVLSVFLCILLTFLLGISLSFLVSVIYTRSFGLFLGVVGAFISLIIGHNFLGLYGLEVILPSLGLQFSLPPLGADMGTAWLFLSSTIALILAFSFLAVLFVRECYEEVTSDFEEVLPLYLPRFSFLGRYQPYVAKEFVDLVRSGTLGKMVFSFAAPLVFLSLSTWYVNHGLNIPVGFNTIFYAAMVGFFGVLLYAWITNVDLTDYYETLPVQVPTIIKSKLIVHSVLTLGISTTFVVAIGFINGESDMLWLALPVLYVTSAYMVVATAYLTGITPSSFLFNPEILVKFSVISLLPDLCLTILSFSVPSSPVFAASGILLVCAVLCICAYFFYRGIEVKWADEEFV